MGMTGSNFNPAQRIADSDDNLAGFRLQRLELWNWGTFHGRRWELRLDGANGLLTGDIGSGKSTLVDAVTTLLLPRSSYNKAAGAEKAERSVRSYVLGHHKSELNEATGSTQAVALRSSKDYSVVLAAFHNVAYGQYVTLAQVFWMREQNAPERLFVVADRDLTIAEHFGNFGGEIPRLRKTLRDLDGTQTFQHFSEYAAEFQRRFDIQTKQALELFHQTVSMKSVGNLTEFVRSHMLEQPDVSGRIQNLLAHFDDLTGAHEKVLTAKQQIEFLSPLVENCNRYQQQSVQVVVLRECRDAIPSYFASLKRALIADRLLELEHTLRTELEALEQAKVGCAETEAEIRRVADAIREQGGDRVEELQETIRIQTAEVSRRTRNFEAHASRLQLLKMQPSTTEEEFHQQIRQLDSLQASVADEVSTRLNTQVSLQVEMQTLRDQHQRVSEEIESLQHRTSNIDARLIQLRMRLCSELKMSEEELPFAGELLQVKQGEGKWEGAIERVLRGFASSMLVPDARYAGVASWVDQTNLKGRLAYFHVRPTRVALSQSSPKNNSLVYKVEIKPHAMAGWMQRQLQEQFDYACCAVATDLLNEYRGVTMAGQIKTPGSRYFKDDSFGLNERSRFVLGWSNHAKLAILRQDRESLEAEIAAVAAKVSQIQGDVKEATERGRIIVALLEHREYRDFDLKTIETELAQSRLDLKQLEAASDTLAVLQTQKAALEVQLSARRDGVSALDRQIGSNIDQRKILEQEALELEARITTVAIELEQRTAQIREEVSSNSIVTLKNCDAQERGVRDEVDRRIRLEERRISDLRSLVELAMQSFCTSYPVETQEFGARVDAQAEYRAMLQQLMDDDLPRFEEEFAHLLRRNSMTEIGQLLSFLNQRATEIEERIAEINESLLGIEYNREGRRARYIRLVQTQTVNLEVRQFRDDLRACMDGALSATVDGQPTEARFFQVKALMDRFRGRPGLTDVDKKWCDLVTDVRQWFTFSASERWLDDDQQHEHYSDSAGKSGGQKEKLAYTVLAAGLAYQFRLNLGEIKAPGFRFVMIDEAFGRGSEESARYALELFQKLNLQILIVTPLSKINVIAPFVRHVGFVANPTGSYSVLRNITIEEYRQRKQDTSA